MFITIEGVSNRDDLIAWLVDHIRRTAGRDVLQLNFPSPTLRETMEFALDKVRTFPRLSTSVIAADYHSRAGQIRAHLRTGGIVLVERWIGTAINDGIVHGIDREWLELLFADLPTSDLNILLDEDHPFYAVTFRRLWQEWAAKNPRVWQVLPSVSPRSAVWNIINTEFQRSAF